MEETLIAKEKVKDLLPDKPSAILRAALGDLVKAEKDPKFVVEMGNWVEVDQKTNRCEVCLAGSALVNTCQMGPRPFDWDEIPDSLDRKMEFLNDVRCGWIESGLYMLGIGRPKGIPENVDIIDYDIDPAEFKADLHWLADRFEAAGI